MSASDGFQVSFPSGSLSPVSFLRQPQPPTIIGRLGVGRFGAIFTLHGCFGGQRYRRRDISMYGCFWCTSTFGCMAIIYFYSRSDQFLQRQRHELFSHKERELRFSFFSIFLLSSDIREVRSLHFFFFFVSPYSRIIDTRAKMEHHLFETQRKPNARHMKLCQWAICIRTNAMRLVTNTTKEHWRVPGGMKGGYPRISKVVLYSVASTPFPFTLRALLAPSIPTSTSLDAHRSAPITEPMPPPPLFCQMLFCTVHVKIFFCSASSSPSY